MPEFILHVDNMLRGRDAVSAVPARRPVAQLVATVVVFGALYGVCMGTFGGGQPLQMLYSGLKVPMLLGVTFALSLPSFFVLNSLAGLGPDFPAALRALLKTQAVLAVILASLAPFTLLWYASSNNYQAAIPFNGAMFAVASASAQWILRKAYSPLIARQPRHRWMLLLWLVLYGFVGIQMGWVLRPFVGDPGHAVTFFRSGSWGNAYVELLRILGEVGG